MKRNHILLLSLILLGVSCSKKDAISPQDCVVVKRTIAAVGLTLVVAYEYNAERKLTKVTESYPGFSFGVPFSFSYTFADGVITSVAVTNLKTQAVATAAWTHENNRLTKVGSGPNARTISYDGNNRVVSARSGSSSVFTEILASYATDGRLKTIGFNSQSGTSSNSIVYTYSSFDGEKNPNSLLAKSMNQPIFFEKEGTVFIENLYTGNPLSEDVVLNAVDQGATTTTTSRSTFKYEYGTSGYPTKITKTTDGVVVSTTTFEYKDCN